MERKATVIARKLRWTLIMGALPLVAFARAHPYAPPRADTPATSEVRDETPEQVLELVRRLFDGMREADSVKVRSVFAEGARFAAVSLQNGTESVEYSTADGFVTSVGRSERRWDERIVDVEIRVDDGMAMAWVPYSFYLDGQLRHCGVNLVDLVRLTGTWKITQLTDTRRTVGCRELPPGSRG